MKLSKEKIKLHNQAEEYLKKDVLTFDEKLFVLENWNEAATCQSFSKQFQILLLEE